MHHTRKVRFRLRPITETDEFLFIEQLSNIPMRVVDANIDVFGNRRL